MPRNVRTNCDSAEGSSACPALLRSCSGTANRFARSEMTAQVPRIERPGVSKDRFTPRLGGRTPCVGASSPRRLTPGCRATTW